MWGMLSVVYGKTMQNNLRLRTQQVAGRWSFFFPILLSCLGHNKLRLSLHSCSSTSSSTEDLTSSCASKRIYIPTGAHGISNFGRQHPLFYNRGFYYCVPSSIWMDEQQKHMKSLRSLAECLRSSCKNAGLCLVSQAVGLQWQSALHIRGDAHASGR